MSRNRHHPVRLAKGGKRLAPDKREGVGLIATAGMAAVVALISMMNRIRYYLRAIRWLWENRSWKNTRQKWKEFDRAMKEYCDEQ